MKRVCQFCRETYGEKEPIEDESETTGSCDLCHWLWMVWYALWSEKMTSETATDFILSCRETLAESHKESVIQNYLEVRRWL